MYPTISQAPRCLISGHACLILQVVLFFASLAQANGAIIFSSGDLNAGKAVYFEDYQTTGKLRSPIPESGASGSFSNGVYPYPTGNAIALLASGAGIPTMSLTITNTSGSTITKLVFSGLRYQFRDNAADLTEKLVASVSGLSIPSAAVLDILQVGNVLDGAYTYHIPPITAPYQVTLENLSFESGQSFTITWTDNNSSVEDSLFGIGGLTITPTAVPEPSPLLVLAGGACAFALWNRRRRSAA